MVEQFLDAVQAFINKLKTDIINADLDSEQLHYKTCSGIESITA